MASNVATGSAETSETSPDEELIAEAFDAPALGEWAVAWTRPRVLVVEDNADLREMIAHYLLEEGFEVTSASSAEDGLDQLRAQPYEAVLTDYSLAGNRTGSWLIEQACAERLVHAANCVLLTGRRRPEVLQGVRVLQKPYDLLSLRLEVEGAVEG